jgi:hypothetical protein
MDFFSLGCPLDPTDFRVVRVVVRPGPTGSFERTTSLSPRALGIAVAAVIASPDARRRSRTTPDGLARGRLGRSSARVARPVARASTMDVLPAADAAVRRTLRYDADESTPASGVASRRVAAIRLGSDWMQTLDARSGRCDAANARSDAASSSARTPIRRHSTTTAPRRRASRGP